jgi:hypothetical protein
MALFSKLKDSLLGLKGEPGPNFENEGQKVSSNIQALSKNNIMVSSQDLISGRTYGNGTDRVKIAPSALDLNGKTPLSYTKALGSTNAGTTSQFSSNTSGFTLEKRLAFSPLGNQGKPLPNFENIGQLTTSDIQAKAKSNALQSSQDLITGRFYGKGRFQVFVAPSKLDNNGLPVGSVYKNNGPKEGRY